MPTNLLQKGNSKLGKSIYSFSLPPIDTCTPSVWCKKHCYACKGMYVVHKKNIQPYFQRAFKASLQDSFVQKICDEINTHPSIKYIRIHVAGDFYSPEYVEKWVWIAYLNPGIKFLAFTKRRDLKGPLQALAELPNVMIRESIDISRGPSLPFPKATVFNLNINIPSIGVICSGHCDGCFKCWYTDENIILPAH